MAKQKTQAQLDKVTDTRLQKAYGISLAEYNGLLAYQGGVCAICKKPPTGRRHHVDHDHSWTKVKVESSKDKPSGVWLATAIWKWDSLPFPFTAGGETKSIAIRKVKRQLLRASVRGILCAWCNRGLRYYHDNPEFMQNAADYLRRKRKEG